MTNAQDSLKEFESQGKTEEPSQQKEGVSNPTIKLHNSDGTNTGLFVVGKFLCAKSVVKDTAQGKRTYMFVDMVLEKTNAVATLKDGAKYKEVPVKSGDIVTLYAASRLFNAATKLSPGSRLYAAYTGGIIQKGKMVHSHVVKSLPGTLTPAEAEYIASKNRKKEAAVDAAKSKSEEDKQAADAMGQLED